MPILQYDRLDEKDILLINIAQLGQPDSIVPFDALCSSLTGCKTLYDLIVKYPASFAHFNFDVLSNDRFIELNHFDDGRKFLLELLKIFIPKKNSSLYQSLDRLMVNLISFSPLWSLSKTEDGLTFIHLIIQKCIARNYNEDKHIPDTDKYFIDLHELFYEKPIERSLTPEESAFQRIVSNSVEGRNLIMKYLSSKGVIQTVEDFNLVLNGLNKDQAMNFKVIHRLLDENSILYLSELFNSNISLLSQIDRVLLNSIAYSLFEKVNLNRHVSSCFLGIIAQYPSGQNLLYRFICMSNADFLFSITLDDFLINDAVSNQKIYTIGNLLNSINGIAILFHLLNRDISVKAEHLRYEVVNSVAIKVDFISKIANKDIALLHELTNNIDFVESLSEEDFDNKTLKCLLTKDPKGEIIAKIIRCNENFSTKKFLLRLNKVLKSKGSNPVALEHLRLKEDDIANDVGSADNGSDFENIPVSGSESDKEADVLLHVNSAKPSPARIPINSPNKMAESPVIPTQKAKDSPVIGVKSSGTKNTRNGARHRQESIREFLIPPKSAPVPELQTGNKFDEKQQSKKHRLDDNNLDGDAPKTSGAVAKENIIQESPPSSPFRPSQKRLQQKTAAPDVQETGFKPQA